MQGKRRIRSALALIVTGTGLLTVAPAAPAKTYTPDKTGDSPSGGLSLREAITKANNRLGSDKIVLEGGKTYKLSIPGTGDDFNATGDLDIRNGALRIESDSKKVATVNAQGLDRVFDVVHGIASAQLIRLKIIGGNAVGDGGGVRVFDGGLSVSRSVISGNRAVDQGGGIASDSGPVSISKTSIKGNVGMDIGGGISILSASLTVTNSTISGNTGVEGGGIYNEDSQLSVVNSTIANNTVTDSSGDGGGIASNGAGSAVSLNAVTIARNHANDRGGGFDKQAPASSFVVRNSLIALNSAPDGPDCSEFGSATSLGQNLIGNNTDCTGFGPGAGDFVNLSVSQIRIGTLKDNGGSTKTIALKKGSVAINHAGSDAPKRDQRGEKRKKPDIGAFERL
jgi:hypothetical protein